jgi:hypothetical protein
MTSHFQAVSFGAGHSWLVQPAQIDDVQSFVQGFHPKYVADVQKLAEVGDLFIFMRSVLCIVR